LINHCAPCSLPITNKFGKAVEQKSGGPRPGAKGPANAPGKSGTFADLFANAKNMRDKK
jgi:hypothetical protein